MVQVYHEIDISDTSMQDQEAIDRLQSQMKVSLTEMLVKRLISEKVKDSLSKSGYFDFPKKEVIKEVKKEEKNVIKEALVTTPNTFILKTEIRVRQLDL